jgi:amino acid efflux transporter
MNSLQRKLTLKDGVAISVGSIMGSGILFLPSLSYSVAGNNVLVSWLIATLLCIPLTVVFSDMVRVVPNESGLEGFINLGLGRHLAAAIPIIILGAVCIGMPSAALIAGDYLSRALGYGSLVSSIIAFLLVMMAVLANISGVKTRSLFQSVIAFLLFTLGFGLFFVTLPQAAPLYHQLRPTFEFSPTLSGVVIVFWAYAGFENMTFLAGEFRYPQRDITLSILIALLICSILYIGLTANYSVLVNHSEINQLTGLTELAEVSIYAPTIKVIVTALAVGAVLVNFISWFWGISRLVYSSSGKGFLPGYLFKLNESGIPVRSLLFLLFIFSLVLAFFSLSKDQLAFGLKLVSTNLVFLYFLAALSFTKYSVKEWKKVLGGAITILLMLAMLSSGWLLLYPIILLLLSLGRSFLAARTTNSNKRP